MCVCVCVGGGGGGGGGGEGGGRIQNHYIDMKSPLPKVTASVSADLSDIVPSPSHTTHHPTLVGPKWEGTHTKCERDTNFTSS